MARRRPTIGINCDLQDQKSVIRSSYYDCVAQSGGVPLLLPPTSGIKVLEATIGVIDGLLLIGGDDYSPKLYGEDAISQHRRMPPRREQFDLRLARRVLRARIPVLGVCGGCQLINIARGGGLLQDIRSQWPDALEHGAPGGTSRFHTIQILPETRLRAVLGQARLRVNSKHHQAVDRLGRGLRVAARSSDGIVEAIEDPGAFVIGVQWHPERMPHQPSTRALFNALIAEALRR